MVRVPLGKMKGGVDGLGKQPNASSIPETISSHSVHVAQSSHEADSECQLFMLFILLLKSDDLWDKLPLVHLCC